MTLKKLLCLALSLLLVFSLVPWSYAEDSTTVYVAADGADGAYTTLADAYAAVTDGGTIELKEDIALAEKLILNETKTVTLDGQGHTITYSGVATITPEQYGLLTITSGKVDLSNVTVQMPEVKSVNGRVLVVNGTARVTLGTGTVLANGYLGYGGGGVAVLGGNLEMADGAAIQNCYIANNTTAYGGGVLVDGGTFTMRGGTITGNTIHTTTGYASYGGGVAVLSGRFNLYGGSITGNCVDTAGGGVYLAEEAKLYLGGTGTITDNTANGMENDLFLPSEKSTFLQNEQQTGLVGITHGKADYDVAVGVHERMSHRYTVADEDAYFYNGGKYDIRLRNDALVLWKHTVKVTTSGEHFGITVEEAPIGEDLDFSISLEDGYRLPKEISISIGDSPIDFTPIQSGAVHIPGDAITDTVVVTAAPDKLHKITMAVQNVDYTPKVAPMTDYDELTITFSAADRYAMPENVTITGSCDYTYAEGILTLRNVTDNVTITAKGAEIYHTLHFDPAGGTVDKESISITESQLTLGTLPTPERTGYTFSGWFTPSGTRVMANTENYLKSDLTLTARWSANTNIRYQVQHWIELVDSGTNPGYVPNSTETTVLEYGGSAKTYYRYAALNFQNGIADGHKDITFAGLSEVDGLSMQGLIASGVNEYSVTMAPDSSSVFPLYYDRDIYAINYDANGGSLTDTQTSTAALYGSLYGEQPSATRPGYALDGWYTTAHGGDKVLPEDVVLVTENQTLYAHWKTTGDTRYTVVHMVQALKDNTVSYDKAASDSYSEYHKDTFTADADSTVDLYALAIPGFTPSSDNLYTVAVAADGSSVTTLYYDRDIYAINYDANGGSLTQNVQTILYFGGSVPSLPSAPVRTGYLFSGWYTGKEETAQPVRVGTKLEDITTAVEAGSITLYAHWSKDESYRPNRPSGGSTGSTGSISEGGNGSSGITGLHNAYITGYSDGTFRPGYEIARCEAVAIFARLASDYDPNAIYPVEFPDVATDAWYRNYLGYCVAKGIIVGCPDGTFAPFSAVTRGEFAAVAMRFQQITVFEGATAFDDITGHWAEDYINAAAFVGWVKGDGSTKHYYPDRTMTRAEAVTLINAATGRNPGTLPEGLEQFGDCTNTEIWYYKDVMESAYNHTYWAQSAQAQEVWQNWNKGE